MLNATEQFRDVIGLAGLVPPENIHADGKIHRFSSSDRRGDDAGWYVFHHDGIPAGCFGDWRTGINQSWRADIGRELSPSEEAENRARIEAMQREREAEDARRKEDARKKAEYILSKCTPAPGDFPYLVKKGVKPNGALLYKESLAIPMRENGVLHSIQFIDKDGGKRFLFGGRISGCYFSIGKAGHVICIAEGFATAATIHEATGHAVAVAFNAGNLGAVAQTVRKRHPEASIIICADDDIETDGNPGIAKAIAAAKAVSGLVAFPDFGSTRPQGATDFNDLCSHKGPNAILSAITNAIAPDMALHREPPVSASKSDSASREWPEPQPIKAELLPVPPFDAETLLPASLRDWVMDEADRMPCPPDFIAATAIVAIGSVIGARCAIKPKSRDDWMVVPNLWGGLVGLPSAKKSPAIGAGLKPLDRLVANAMKAHKADKEAYEIDQTVFNARTEAIEKQIKAAAVSKGKQEASIEELAAELQRHRSDSPSEPTIRRFKSNDSTVEKLGELLRENPHGLLMMRDELVGLLSSWDREGREGERAFYLEAWNGNASFDTDRIGRGSIFIENLCVSIFGGIQPDKLTSYLEQASHALSNDGMLQRFQVLVYPDHCKWEWRDRVPSKAYREKAFQVVESLGDFDPVAWGASQADDFCKFPHFRFDQAAQQVFIEWQHDLHRNKIEAEDNPIIAQHLAKFDKLFPALSLILHLVECADTGRTGDVTAEAALRAAAWCDYLEAHSRRCYGLLLDDGLRAAQALAKKIHEGKIDDGFTARDVRRNQWRYLTTDEAVQSAIDWLEDEHWIASEAVGGSGQGSGRKTYRYHINPKALKSGGRND